MIDPTANRDALLAFHNGRFIPAPELSLDVADAGFVFGATVTDFCRTYGRRLFRWPDHLARLRRDCEMLAISLPYTDSALTAAAERLVECNAPLHDTEELTLVSFATPGPLGYLTETGSSGLPTLGMHTVPLRPDRYRHFFAEGATLTVIGRLPTDGLLPTAVKHRSRLHWWLATQRVTEPGAIPVLYDDAGAADAPLGAILAVCDGTVYRSRRGSVLESVSLGVVAELCERRRLQFAEADLDIRRLQDRTALMGQATELLLAGSGLGIAGVRRVIGLHGERTFTWPGPVLKVLLDAWSELVGRDVVQQMLNGR